jgi:hypothetical protein
VSDAAKLSRDEEVEIAEQAERAAQYYMGLTRAGVPRTEAANITSAWVLGNLKKSDLESDDPR